MRELLLSFTNTPLTNVKVLKKNPKTSNILNTWNDLKPKQMTVSCVLDVFNSIFIQGKIYVVAWALFLVLHTCSLFFICHVTSNCLGISSSKDGKWSFIGEVSIKNRKTQNISAKLVVSNLRQSFTNTTFPFLCYLLLFVLNICFWLGSL